jgi:glycosyltransferase involved in cell wall biosynthesis
MISEHASPLAVIGGVDSGGQNVYVAHVARQLALKGYLVDVFTRQDAPDLPGILEWESGVRVIHVPAGPAAKIPKEAMLPYMQDLTAFMLDFFQQQKAPYDLVHAHFWMSGLVAADLKKMHGIPYVITFHALGRVRRQYQGKNDSFPDIRFEIEDRVAAEADRIIAECPQDRVDLLSLYHADPGKLAIIPCGFDPQEMYPIDKNTAREKLSLPQDEWVILQLGRMVPRKGVDNVLRGFARFVLEHKIPARLLIVGGESREPDPDVTPEIGRLMAIAAQEGVSDRVIFTGRRNRDEIKDYYSAADVFISTPWYEPFGITPVEAMACCVPVIGSDVGGIKYTVRDGETGFLVPPNDPNALSKRLLSLYQNPGLLKKFQDQAVRRANEFFTWEKVADSIAELYEDVLGERTKASVQPFLTTD